MNKIVCPECGCDCFYQEVLGEDCDHGRATILIKCLICGHELYYDVRGWDCGQGL
jgi:uncharacterized Zn finger protein